MLQDSQPQRLWSAQCFVRLDKIGWRHGYRASSSGRSRFAHAPSIAVCACARPKQAGLLLHFLWTKPKRSCVLTERHLFLRLVPCMHSTAQGAHETKLMGASRPSWPLPLPVLSFVDAMMPIAVKCVGIVSPADGDWGQNLLTFEIALLRNCLICEPILVRLPHGTLKHSSERKRTTCSRWSFEKHNGRMMRREGSR